MAGTALIVYLAVGCAFAYIAETWLLKGNYHAPTLVHFQIGLVGGLIMVVWPLALVWYAVFFAAKRTTR